jgi:hypothetical protein
MEISWKYPRVLHPQRQYGLTYLHQLRPIMKKAWLAMMLPDNRHAWQVSVSRLSARLRCRSPPRA